MDLCKYVCTYNLKYIDILSIFVMVLLKGGRKLVAAVKYFTSSDDFFVGQPTVNTAHKNIRL